MCLAFWVDGRFLSPLDEGSTFSSTGKFKFQILLYAITKK